MAKIKRIIIHCSDSKHGSSADIRRWHVQENGWRDIGYHFIINNGNLGQGLIIESMDGAIEIGREMDGNGYLDTEEIGAHALGANADSIGICLIGKGEYTPAQMFALKRLTGELCVEFGISKENIIGHCEVEGVTKSCPQFKEGMDAFRREM